MMGGQFICYGQRVTEMLWNVLVCQISTVLYLDLVFRSPSGQLNPPMYIVPSTGTSRIRGCKELFIGSFIPGPAS